MQPHIPDGTRVPAMSGADTDRRSSVRRWSTDLVVTRYVVVLNLGPAHRAELINESNGGIAVLVRELDRSADAKRTIEVIYRGKRHSAKIRHIAENEYGFLVGLQWKKRNSQ
jgi:hypothetical protein